MDKYIRIRGARQHNLKNINLDISDSRMKLLGKNSSLICIEILRKIVKKNLEFFCSFFAG